MHLRWKRGVNCLWPAKFDGVTVVPMIVTTGAVIIMVMFSTTKVTVNMSYFRNNLIWALCHLFLMLISYKFDNSHYSAW